MKALRQWWGPAVPVLLPEDIGLARIPDDDFELLLDRLRAGGSTDAEIAIFRRIRDFRRERAFVIKTAKLERKDN